jgi:hypothetical protein
VADAESAASDRVEDGAVAGAVVCEELLDLDPVAAVEGNRTGEEAGRCRGRLILEDFGVGKSAVVVDGDVDELPAGNAGLPAVDPRALLRGPIAAMRWPTPRIRPSFLTSMWISSPGRCLSYLVGCSSPIRPSLPSPSLIRIPETVESGIASVSAISTAVIRSRRN